jgi:hypothetical protein
MFTLRQRRPNVLWHRATHLLWGDSWAARGKITSGTTNSPNYCAVFIVYTQFTNVASGHALESHALRHTVKPVYNGTSTNRNFSFAGRFHFKKVLEILILETPYLRYCKIFRLKAGFHFYKVPFNKSFIVQGVYK